MVREKPLVVLAGWLGCHQRSLRRYEQLFAKKGYQVISKIASPTMVAESCFRPLPPPALVCPPQWPTNVTPLLRSDNVPTQPSSMQDFAWDVLQDVHHRNCPYVIFYAFSNGGCFVWEQVRRILHAAAEAEHHRNEVMHDLQKEQVQVLQNLKHKTAGVVFDSCPSRQLALIGFALAFCTWRERWDVAKSYGIDVAFLPPLVSPSKKTTANLRSVAYYRGLKDDPWDLPQLYLYSKSDMLIPSSVVEELVNHRRHLLGADRIFSRKWESSRHCAHYVDHPEEYEATLDTFLDVTRSSKTEPKAKL